MADTVSAKPVAHLRSSRDFEANFEWETRPVHPSNQQASLVLQSIRSEEGAQLDLAVGCREIFQQSRDLLTPPTLHAARQAQN